MPSLAFLNMSMFGEYRDIDGQRKVKLYSAAAVTKGNPYRWVLGTGGRDESAAIVAGRDVRQKLVFAEKTTTGAGWSWFVVDGPIQSRDEYSGLETVTVPSGTYTLGNGLRIDPFSAALQDSGVPFDFSDESHVGEIVATVTSSTTCQLRLFERESIFPTESVHRRKFDRFRTRPLFSDDDGDGIPTGTTGDVNIMKTDVLDYEYAILGAGQTIVMPVWATTGVDIGLDQTTTEGIEITNGISSLSRFAFTVGTDACYFKVKVKVADASGANPLLVGFRKAEAYQADEDDYDEMVAIGLVGTANPNTIKIQTILNAAATVSTDTTQTWADAATKTLEVYVTKAGVVTFKIDGAAPTATKAFTFDNAEVIVPFLYFLNAADLAGAVELIEWQAGIYAGDPK